ncbi:13198_t:CDS:2 [Rhizophagus irregularis]|nr:13198_t:CDS:2 [Rhizophagus irregularis]
MNQIKLYGKPIRVNKATSDKKNLDVDASLFIRNLDPDPDTGDGKGYGFISCDNFDSSDAAIDAMNGQYLMNKPITVSYAFKKDGKGERHGSAAERLLAAQAKKIKNLWINTQTTTQPSPRISIMNGAQEYFYSICCLSRKQDVDQRLGIEIDRFALPESNW